LPLSSSSSLTRQHRPHPSQRLSHSAGFNSSRDFCFQNGGSSASFAVPRGLDAASLLREDGGGIRPAYPGVKVAASLALRHGNRQEGWVEQFPVEGRRLWFPAMPARRASDRPGWRAAVHTPVGISRICFGNEIVDRVLMSLSHIAAFVFSRKAAHFAGTNERRGPARKTTPRDHRAHRLPPAKPASAERNQHAQRPSVWCLGLCLILATAALGFILSLPASRQYGGEYRQLCLYPKMSSR
jgi:hypothetical protein